MVGIKEGDKVQLVRTGKSRNTEWYVEKLEDDGELSSEDKEDVESSLEK
jgi:hypothetical protein